MVIYFLVSNWTKMLNLARHSDWLCCWRIQHGIKKLLLINQLILIFLVCCNHFYTYLKRTCRKKLFNISKLLKIWHMFCWSKVTLVEAYFFSQQWWSNDNRQIKTNKFSTTNVKIWKCEVRLNNFFKQVLLGKYTYVKNDQENPKNNLHLIKTIFVKVHVIKLLYANLLRIFNPMLNPSTTLPFKPFFGNVLTF